MRSRRGTFPRTPRPRQGRNKDGQTQLRRRLGRNRRGPRAPAAAAQEVYPSRAVTIVNPFPPGGAVDVVCRPFAAVLEPLFKQPVVIETKAGAAGAVGAQFAAAARPDGYTLLAHLPSLSGFEAVDKLFGRTPKFTRASFVPIARLTEGPMLLVVNDQTPYTTLKEFVDDARKRPNELLFSSSGLYGALHLPTALFTKAARHPDAAPADQRRRAGADRPSRQQRAGAGHLDRGGERPRSGPASSRRWPASPRSGPRRPARRADPQGARLQRRVLHLGRACSR